MILSKFKNIYYGMKLHLNKYNLFTVLSWTKKEVSATGGHSVPVSSALVSSVPVPHFSENHFVAA